MPRRLTLALRLFLVLGVTLAGAAALSLLLLRELRTLDATYSALLAREVSEQQAARVMQVAFKKQVQEWKNILLRGRDRDERARYISAFRAESRAVAAMGDSLARRITDPSGRRLVRRFLAEHAALDSAYDAGLARFQADDGQDPFAIDRLLRGKDRAPTDLIDALVRQRQHRVDAEIEAQHAAVEAQQRTLGIAAGVLLLVLLAVPFVLSRTLVLPVRELQEGMRRVADGELSHRVTLDRQDELGDLAREFSRMQEALRGILRALADETGRVSALAADLSTGSEQLGASAREVADASHAIAEAAAQQTEGTTATLQTSGDVLDGARHITQEALATERTVQATAQRVDEGRAAVQGAQLALEEIGSSAEEALPALESLRERTRRVDEFVDVIAGIAAQSKLLALNAAIEAARAGDQGRGFGVVADEVGKLAHASQDALANIRALVQAIRGAVDDITVRVAGVDDSVNGSRARFERITQALDGVLNESTAARAAAERIVGITEEQREAVERLHGALSQTAASAEQNAATAQQVSAATQEQLASAEHLSATSRELTALARRLDGAAARFRG